MKRHLGAGHWIRQWIAYRLNPNLHDLTVDAYNPAVGVITAAGVSAVMVTIFYQLATVNAFGVFKPIMQSIGALLVPGSQGSDPNQGYLGEVAGVFASYFLVFIFWWILGLRLPIVTLNRLPMFVVVAYVLHIVLAWQLFFPWLPL